MRWWLSSVTIIQSKVVPRRQATSRRSYSICCFRNWESPKEGHIKQSAWFYCVHSNAPTITTTEIPATNKLTVQQFKVHYFPEVPLVVIAHLFTLFPFSCRQSASRWLLNLRSWTHIVRKNGFYLAQFFNQRQHSMINESESIAAVVWYRFWIATFFNKLTSFELVQ